MTTVIWITGYYQDEYMYILGKDGLIMNYIRSTLFRKQTKIDLKNDKKTIHKQTW